VVGHVLISSFVEAGFVEQEVHLVGFQNRYRKGRIVSSQLVLAGLMCACRGRVKRH
jgi:hypothetical protein